MSTNKKDERASLDVRNKRPFFSNYDYAGPQDADETSPGTGLYGDMSKHKSVTEFLDKKRKDNKMISASTSIKQLLANATKFQKIVLGQEVSMDYSMIDRIKASFGKAVGTDYSKLLQTNHVSSTEIRVYYENGVARFEVMSVGTDAAAVQTTFTEYLNKKYAAKMGATIKAALKGKPSTFNFQLATFE